MTTSFCVVLLVCFNEINTLGINLTLEYDMVPKRYVSCHWARRAVCPMWISTQGHNDRCPTHYGENLSKSFTCSCFNLVSWSLVMVLLKHVAIYVRPLNSYLNALSRTPRTPVPTHARIKTEEHCSRTELVERSALISMISLSRLT